jgi:hypothetical protein
MILHDHYVLSMMLMVTVRDRDRASGMDGHRRLTVPRRRGPAHCTNFSRGPGCPAAGPLRPEPGGPTVTRTPSLSHGPTVPAATRAGDRASASESAVAAGVIGRLTRSHRIIPSPSKSG